MKAQRLPPFPSGWFLVALSKDLPAGRVLTRRFAGRDLVLFRTEAGTAAAIDAYCPHMGAHFGHGGKVVGESIRCPFHDFRFDPTGACVATGYGTKPPPTAVAPTLPVREKHGLILVYSAAGGEAPEWEVPDLDTTGWTPLLTRAWRLHSHPQETTENSVDIGHLAVIHGYKAVEMLSDLSLDGPHLNVRYGMSRPGLMGKWSKPVRTEIEIHVWGLGYSVVEVNVTSHGLLSRHFVFSTPVDDGVIELRVGLSMRHISNPGRLNPLARLAPRSLLNAAVPHAVFRGFCHDVQQDFPIWENKVYVHPPALAAGDGPVGQYRRWCRQFYNGTNGPLG